MSIIYVFYFIYNLDFTVFVNMWVKNFAIYLYINCVNKKRVAFFS